MIKNNRQLTAAKERLAVLKSELETLEQSKDDLDPFEYTVTRNTHFELIEALQKDADYFTDLQDGKILFFNLKSLDQISDALIAARIAQKMSQKELGEKLGIHEQAIQRYEISDYRTAGWERVLEVSAALGLIFDGNRIYLKKQGKTVFDTATVMDDKTKTEWKKSFAAHESFHDIGEYENNNILQL